MAVPEVEKRETVIQAQKRMRSRHCNLSNSQIVHYLRLTFDDRIGPHIGHSFCINNEDAENMLRSERAELWLQAFTDVARYLSTIDCTYVSETEILDAIGLAIGIFRHLRTPLPISRSISLVLQKITGLSAWIQ